MNKKYETGIVTMCILAIILLILFWYFETFYIKPKIQAKQIKSIVDELDEETKQKIVNEVDK